MTNSSALLQNNGECPEQIILVVSDKEQCVQQMQDGLERHGYSVLAVQGVLAAITMLEMVSVKLMIVDPDAEYFSSDILEEMADSKNIEYIYLTKTKKWIDALCSKIICFKLDEIDSLIRWADNYMAGRSVKTAAASLGWIALLAKLVLFK